jgi:hypothetical protein
MRRERSSSERIANLTWYMAGLYARSKPPRLNGWRKSRFHSLINFHYELRINVNEVNHTF